MSKGSYWQRLLSRRSVLRYGGIAGLGIAGASLIACGEEEATPAATSTPATTSTPTASLTVTGTAPVTSTAPTTSTPATSPTVATNIRRGGNPRLVHNASIDHLDPATNTWGGGWVMALAYGQLFKWARPPVDDPGALIAEAYMAESMETPDELTAIVKIRPGITFHTIAPVNGREMAPEDIAATWARIKDPATASTRILQQEPVHIPETVDATTVRFGLDYPYAPFFNYIADVWQSILAREAIEQGTDWIKQNVIGTGPYQVDRIDQGVEAVLTARPIPWWSPWQPNEPAPYYDGMTLSIIPSDVTQATIVMLGGQGDYTWSVARPEWENFESDSRFATAAIIDQSFNYARINTAVEPMGDLRVRQAFSLSLDREGVVNSVFDGTAASATGPIPASRTPWGQDPQDLPYHQFDPTQAKQLLTAAGFPDGLELVSLYPGTEGSQTDYIKGFSSQLEQVGIKLNHDVLEYGAYLEKARLGKTDPANAGWQVNLHAGNRYNDIDGYLAEFRTDGGRNYGLWGSPELDEMISAQARISDVNERVAAVHEINRIISEQAWAPGLVLPIYMAVWNAKIQNHGEAAEWYTGGRSFIDSWFRE